MDKLLDVLKAGTWKALGLAIAAGLAIFGLHLKVIPDPGASITFGVYAFFLLGSALAVVGALQALVSYVEPAVWIAHWRRKNIRKKEVEAYIGFMTEDDRKIVSYLLHHKQKMFCGAADGGNASVLIARGIVNAAVRPGYQYDPEQIPFAISDEAWEVLSKRKDEFPYVENQDGRHPWRVNWMAR
jgi:hypothetical protein